MRRLTESLKKQVYSFLRFAPTSAADRIRPWFYRVLGVAVGKSVRLGVGSIIDSWNDNVPGAIRDHVDIGENCVISGGVFIGSNTSINRNVHLVASKPSQITIGKDCLIAQNVVIRSDNHNFADITRPIRSQGHTGADISIGDDCWIGANAVVLKGVSIGAHSVVGAGSVVTKSFCPYSVILGNPAVLIRSRKQ